MHWESVKCALNNLSIGLESVSTKLAAAIRSALTLAMVSAALSTKAQFLR